MDLKKTGTGGYAQISDCLLVYLFCYNKSTTSFENSSYQHVEIINKNNLGCLYWDRIRFVETVEWHKNC